MFGEPVFRQFQPERLAAHQRAAELRQRVEEGQHSIAGHRLAPCRITPLKPEEMDDACARN